MTCILLLEYFIRPANVFSDHFMQTLGLLVLLVFEVFQFWGWRLHTNGIVEMSIVVRVPF